MSCTTLCLETSSRTALLSAARKGDRDAFSDLLMPYAPVLYRRALRLTGNSADAEDAQQEALLKAFTRLDQFSGDENEAQSDFNAWVARITTNASIDLLRHRRDSRHVPLENGDPDSPGNVAGHLPAHGANPEERYARREMRSMLARVITQLPSELRQVCLLRDVMQYSTQEVAERLGISSVAVRLRLFRAHRRLHEDLRSTLRRDAQKASASTRSLQRSERRSRSKVLSFPAVPECACGD